MQKSPEAEPIMTPLCKGGSKTPPKHPRSNHTSHQASRDSIQVFCERVS